MQALRCLVAPALALVLAGAHAHDTWLVPPADPAGGLLTLHLTTGERYPKREAAMAPESIVASGCADEHGAALALKPMRLQGDVLLLRARAAKGSTALACWVRTQEFEVKIEPPLVEVYLKEIQAPPPVRQAWQRQQAAGVPWHEVYAKTARIEFARAGAPASLAALRRPVGTGLEIVPMGDAPLRTGGELAARVLLDGQPLPGLAVEFVSERAPLGVWRTSDAAGIVRSPLPFPGRWLVRATHLVPPPQPAAPWRSRFATLAVAVP